MTRACLASIVGFALGCGDKDADSGEPAGTPDIEVSASEVDFGEVQPGESGLYTLRMANRGDGVLQISLALLEIYDGAGVFTHDWSFPDLVDVAPGEDVPLTLTCQPPDASPHPLTGRLTIVSNDPDEPEVEVAIRCDVADSPDP